MVSILRTKAVATEPFCHFFSVKSDVRLDFEVGNQIAFRIAVQRFRAEVKNISEFLYRE